MGIRTGWDNFRSLFTFRRVFPLAFFLMIFALAVRQSAYIDPDLWWHLQTGQDIFLTKTIPHVDIYSFTKAGSEWVTHEWLSEVLDLRNLPRRRMGWTAIYILRSDYTWTLHYLPTL